MGISKATTVLNKIYADENNSFLESQVELCAELLFKLRDELHEILRYLFFSNTVNQDIELFWQSLSSNYPQLVESLDSEFNYVIFSYFHTELEQNPLASPVEAEAAILNPLLSRIRERAIPFEPSFAFWKQYLCIAGEHLFDWFMDYPDSGDTISSLRDLINRMIVEGMGTSEIFRPLKQTFIRS